LRDLLQHSKSPVILSHSDCRALCDHPRNIGDDLLRALAAQGGVIQINALPISIVDLPGSGRTAGIAEVLLKFKDAELSPETMAAEDKEYDRVCADHPNPRVTFDDFIRHIEHAAEVAGIDHVGIGCDLDGGGGHFEGLRDVADFPNITRELLARGWSEADLAKLWGGNTLRVFECAELRAK
jgi:membrane dipeptidase